MNDAPERIWAKANYGRSNAGYWRDEPIIPNKPENSGTEYVRVDLFTATDERVRRLAEAVDHYLEVTADPCHTPKEQMVAEYKLRAALRDMGVAA